MTDLPEKDKKRKAETAEYSGLFFHLSGDIFVTETSNRCNANERPTGGREM